MCVCRGVVGCGESNRIKGLQSEDWHVRAYVRAETQ